MTIEANGRREEVADWIVGAGDIIRRRSEPDIKTGSHDEKMEIAGFIMLMLGAMMLVMLWLHDAFAVFISGDTLLIFGAILVVAGLVVLFVCNVRQKRR
jgi:uncharacterized protein YjeT (DUF2065 family)